MLPLCVKDFSSVCYVILFMSNSLEKNRKTDSVFPSMKNGILDQRRKKKLDSSDIHLQCAGQMEPICMAMKFTASMFSVSLIQV